MVNDVREFIPLKAEFPIVVTELPMINDLRFIVPEKALSPIVTTELPIVKEVIAVFLLNANSPIPVMSFRITTAPEQADPLDKSVPICV